MKRQHSVYASACCREGVKTLLPLSAKVPRWNRIGINPQSNGGRTCSNFSSSVELPILSSLIVLVVLVMPRHARLNLLKADVLTFEHYLSYYAPISIVFRPLNSHDSIEDCLR